MQVSQKNATGALYSHEDKRTGHVHVKMFYVCKIKFALLTSYTFMAQAATVVRVSSSLVL